MLRTDEVPQSCLGYSTGCHGTLTHVCGAARPGAQRGRDVPDPAGPTGALRGTPQAALHRRGAGLGCKVLLAVHLRPLPARQGTPAWRISWLLFISVSCFRRCRQHNAFIVRPTSTQATAQHCCCDVSHPALVSGRAGTLMMEPRAPAIIVTADYRPDLVDLHPTGH